MQLLQSQAERADRLPHHVQDQFRAGCLEQPIQAAAQAIVVERVESRFRQLQQVGGVAAGPIGHAIDRFARDQHVADQQQQSRGGGDDGPPVLGRQVAFEQGLQIQTFQNVIQDWHRSNGVAAERLVGGFGHLARGTGWAVRVRLLFRHRVETPFAGEAGRKIRFGSLTLGATKCPVQGAKKPESHLRKRQLT